ncbi:carboxypeptidase-like regulatory domain-containing protein [Mucilaginibacter sp. JRF]|uniref:carboxypeptidase-like regulatory domain-containing protein n=1 Tax=Mucilaginibacter sp. JRF TaxID=2780088 RepID=UPI00188121B2|nr:carboxypeptidase-like regulatory domain-containing protein [Mucilaginibacter sp. JRF]MBE9586639.1 carboxypeptidase-like regulatory domain-containing protein [Mucilaginibacter sp. JRF]
MKTILVAFLLLMSCLRVAAQQNLYGRVADTDGAPLAGATVFISESKIGTVTDDKGNFVLRVPGSGNLKVVVSFIGYETQMQTVAPGMGANLSFVMKPVSNQLKDVIITSRSNDNWKRWGEAFTAAFIGSSEYAAHCTIANPQEIGFEFDKSTQILHAYASVPIMVQNEDLGYLVTIALVDFKLYTSSNDVDYQAYYLFNEMKGKGERQARWEENRRKVYALSLMHFTRALYDGRLKEEGFEIRRFMQVDNKEKQRVKKIYDQQYALHADSLKKVSDHMAALNKIIANRFGKDSLRYYKKVLAEKDTEIKMSELLKVDDISEKKDKVRALSFKNQLQVVYKKNKEPEEYYKFRNNTALSTENIAVRTNDISTSQLVMPPRLNPYTEMWLTNSIPVNIKENGAMDNTNLYMSGFWGWWEKIGTKLPYEYYPD